MKDKKFVNKIISKITIITSITTAVTLIIYGINKIINHVAGKISIHEELTSIIKLPVEKHSYNWRLGKVNYQISGSGTPLLLLHDLSCESSSDDFLPVVNELAKHHKLYVLDLPGCGKSEKQKMSYTNYFYVQFLTDFIENIIKHKCDVVAFGNSVSFTLVACSIKESLFRNIILVNPKSISSFTMRMRKRDKIKKSIINIPIYGTLIYHLIFTKQKIKQRICENNKTNTDKIPYDIYYKNSHENNSHGKYLYSSQKANFLNVDLTKAIKQINNSIIILNGEKCEHISTIVNEYLDTNPSIEVFKISNSGYYPQFENPDEVVDLINIYTES